MAGPRVGHEEIRGRRNERGDDKKILHSDIQTHEEPEEDRLDRRRIADEGEIDRHQKQGADDKVAIGDVGLLDDDGDKEERDRVERGREPKAELSADGEKRDRGSQGESDLRSVGEEVIPEKDRVPGIEDLAIEGVGVDENPVRREDPYPAALKHKGNFGKMVGQRIPGVWRKEPDMEGPPGRLNGRQDEEEGQNLALPQNSKKTAESLGGFLPLAGELGPTQAAGGEESGRQGEIEYEQGEALELLEESEDDPGQDDLAGAERKGAEQAVRERICLRISFREPIIWSGEDASRERRVEEDPQSHQFYRLRTGPLVKGCAIYASFT